MQCGRDAKAFRLARISRYTGRVAAEIPTALLAASPLRVKTTQY